MRMIVTPRCCDQMLKTPSIYLETDDDGSNPKWKTGSYVSANSLLDHYNGKDLKNFTPFDHMTQTNTKVNFCSFCGTKAPRIIPRDTSKLKVCKITDGGYYCDTCEERLNCCKCFPPTWNWQPDPKESKIMSYAIGNVSFGFDANDSKFKSLIQKHIDQNEDWECENYEDFLENFCTQYYSAGGEDAALFGILLGRIDECSNTTQDELNSMWDIDEDKRQKWNHTFAFLPDDLQKQLEESDMSPKSFILWSSS